MIKSKFNHCIGVFKRDVHIYICMSFCDKISFIFFLEFADSDSIICVFVLNSFSINSETCWVHIPNSFISVDQQWGHFWGKSYCDLHILQSHIFQLFILW